MIDRRRLCFTAEDRPPRAPRFEPYRPYRFRTQKKSPFLLPTTTRATQALPRPPPPTDPPRAEDEGGRGELHPADRTRGQSTVGGGPDPLREGFTEAMTIAKPSPPTRSAGRQPRLHHLSSCRRRAALSCRACQYLGPLLNFVGEAVTRSDHHLTEQSGPLDGPRPFQARPLNAPGRRPVNLEKGFPDTGWAEAGPRHGPV